MLISGKKKRGQFVIQWTGTQISAFEQSRKLLAQAVTLDHPLPDATIIISTDASGASFNQLIEDQMRPLVFYSRKLTSAEQTYSTFDRELLAIYTIVIKYKDLLEGRTVLIHTDHKPIT